MDDKSKNILGRSVPVIGILIVISLMAKAFVIDNYGGQENNQAKRWEDDLKKEPLPINAKELNLEYFFPNEEQEKKDIYLAQGTHICMDHEDHIYVSDWKAVKILEFDFKGNFIRAFGRKGQGPGEFAFPGQLFCDGRNNLFVDGRNRQIMTFNSNGEFVRSFITTKSYVGYAIDPHGNIYANYSNRKYEEEDLIEVLNQNGALLRSFGKRILFKNITITHNDVFLDISQDQYLYVVWQKFNVFRKYSLDGKLLREGKFKYKALEDISGLNLESKMVEGSIRFRSLFDGMDEDGGKIYVLKNYPRIEIFQCHESGEVERVFWYKSTYNYIGRELIVVPKKDKTYFLTMQVYPEERIEVYSIANEDPLTADNFVNK